MEFTYFDNLFKDPSFAFILSTLSIWYSYYLFKRPTRKNKLCFITKSEGNDESPRKTEMVLLNESDFDITSDDVLQNFPINIRFDASIELKNIEIKQTSQSIGTHEIIKKDVNDYQISFDIIKKGHGIVFVAFHDSKLFMDDVFSEIRISGIIKNYELVRDDFSDYMLYRVNSAYPAIGIGSIIGAAYFMLIFITLFSAAKVELTKEHYIIFAGIGYLISLGFSVNFFLAKVGNERYKKFFSIIEEKRFKRRK